MSLKHGSVKHLVLILSRLVQRSKESRGHYSSIYRSVARTKCAHQKGRGFGSALRRPVGPCQSPGGGHGATPSKAPGF